MLGLGEDVIHAFSDGRSHKEIGRIVEQKTGVAPSASTLTRTS
jgi:hypothetical protein